MAVWTGMKVVKQQQGRNWYLWTVIHFDITNTEQFNLFQFRLLLYILSAVELIHFTPEFIDTLQKNVQKLLSGQFEP